MQTSFGAALAVGKVMNTKRPDVEIVHGTCVAVDAAGVLIRGTSGSGKSGLALKLMALGAELVADDRTRLTAAEGGIRADCPDAIRGRIEARGVGILAAPFRKTAFLKLAIDLDATETERLPPKRETIFFDTRIPLLHGCAFDHFPASIILYLKGGRIS